MSAVLWDAIEMAYQFVVSGGAERIDGIGFKVYRAGTIIRVDIEADA